MPVCDKCGYNNRENNQYCVNCGFPLRTMQGEQKTWATGKPTEWSKIAIGVIIALVVIGTIWGMMPKSATIRIESNTTWSGSIGGDGQSRTVEGSGNRDFTVSGRIIVAVVQKQTGYGFLKVSIIVGGNTVAYESTWASYGVVTVSWGS